jgi:hypothetical protein
VGARPRRGHCSADRHYKARSTWEAVDALELELNEEDFAAIERAVPPGAAAGERYDERQMAMLDSERAERAR